MPSFLWFNTTWRQLLCSCFQITSVVEKRNHQSFDTPSSIEMQARLSPKNGLLHLAANAAAGQKKSLRISRAGYWVKNKKYNSQGRSPKAMPWTHFLTRWRVWDRKLWCYVIRSETFLWMTSYIFIYFDTSVNWQFSLGACYVAVWRSKEISNVIKKKLSHTRPIHRHLFKLYLPPQNIYLCTCLMATYGNLFLHAKLKSQ